jgi:serine/threonine protein kinase
VYDGTLSGKKVAVKKVEMAGFKTDDLSSRKEEEVMKRLDHPNVIQLISIEILGEFKCFVMGHVRSYCQQLFLALRLLKKVNILHADIKGIRVVPEHQLIFYNLSIGQLFCFLNKK